jgi:ATP/ADP translocase
VQVAPVIPTGLHGAIRVVENWTYSLFFGAAELWGSVVIAVLFWSLANDVCTIQEAKTVYPMMGISANVALVAAGNYMKVMNKHILAAASTQTFLQTMVATIVVASLGMALVRIVLAV